MALPSNYKQIAMNMPSGTSPSHMMSPGPAGFHNILKERLRPSGSSGDRGKDNSSPFVHSSHGNPAFTPQKMGKGGVVVDPRAPKPPKPPEKPLMPFMRYSRKVWDQVKTANPELKLWEVSKIIAQMWKDAPDDERQEFIEEYEAEKIQYIDALKVYHATPEFGTWNRYHVNRLKAGVDSEEPMSRSSSKSQQERRLDIQPAEDEEDQDDGYTFKHVAYARFLRNHRLINEIFSDAIVPDVRSVVTTQRMQVLKRQVQSLTMHQMKLETELQQIEEKFEAKKRKFVDSSELFQEELKKHCKPAVDEDTFKKMVERQFEAMRRDRLRQLEEPKVSAAKPEEVVHANAGAPSAPNTTIRPNEVDKPDTAEQVLQPMEAEKVPEEPPAPIPAPVEKKPEPMETNTVPVATPSPADIQPASEENTSENMDIEPPVEPVAHPSSHPVTNKPPSDVPHHPAYVTQPPPVQQPPPTSSSAILAGPPAPITSTPPAGNTPPPNAAMPHGGGPPVGPVGHPHGPPHMIPPHDPNAVPIPPQHQPLPPHHHMAPEGQPMGQPPYGAPGYGHQPPPGPGQVPGGVRPYYPPYQYHPYPPPHQQYGPPPPSHYMPIHPPPHGGPVPGQEAQAPAPVGPPIPPRADEGEEHAKKEAEPPKAE